MNEKIKELKRQATIKIQSHGAFGEPESRGQLDVDKFAELIIQQCMDMVIAHEDDAQEEFHKLWLHMKEHFGVE